MRILARGRGGCRETWRSVATLLVLVLLATAPRALPAGPVAGDAQGKGGEASADSTSPASTSGTSDAAGSGADPAGIPEGTFVRVTLDGGVSPFTSVSWDVTVRGGTAVVSLVKESLCQNGQRERVRLLEGANARLLLATLKDAGAWRCEVPEVATSGRARDRPTPTEQPRYEIWSAWGHRMTRFHLPQSALRDAPCALSVITTLAAEVRARIEPLPMRDLYYPAERLGWVTMTASEAAKATFDGWDTVHLPADALEVVQGEHTVVVTGESGRTQQFKVKVVPGLTQRIHVLLEDPPDGPPPVPDR